MFFNKQNTQKHRLHKILQQYDFDMLIRDNIDDYHIKKQPIQDAKQYCPVKIVKDTPSLTIII